MPPSVPSVKSVVKESQLTLSPLFAHSRPSVSPAEVARALAVCPNQVRALVDAGLLFAFDISDRDRPSTLESQPSTIRRHVRLLRASVDAYWLEAFLETNGCEYPLVNSAEVAALRSLIRQRRSLNSQLSTINR